MTRELGAGGTPPRALVRFAPEARWPTSTRCSTITRPPSSAAPTALFRLQFGSKAMGKDEVASLMSKLRGEKIVSLAEAAP